MSDDNKKSEDLSDFKIDLNLLTYRLTAIENKIDTSLDTLSSKIDNMIKHYTETRSNQALASQSLSQLKDELNKIENRVVKLEAEVVNLKVTFAEKLAYGGIGGGAVAIMIELVRKALEV
jgi:ABC-type transporter Mla subunit MlaD